MTNMFMVRHKRKEIWFGYTLQLYLLTVIANFITLGLDHKVISELSNLNYKIETSIVHLCSSKRKPTLQVKSYYWDN